MRRKANLGIDPGAKGAMALISEDDSFIMDFTNRKEIINLLKRWMFRYEIKLAGLEKVGAMPMQGVVSMFTFGKNVGFWEGILLCLDIPFIEVSSMKWQSKMIDKKAGKSIKEASLETARRLFPKINLKLKKHHGRSDALLIAKYVGIYL